MFRSEKETDMVQKVAIGQKKLEIVSEIPAARLPADLAAHPLLQCVRPRSLTVLSTRFDLLKVARGSTLYTAGAPAKTLYLVGSGAVRTLHRNIAGETLETSWKQGFSVLGMGELLAEASEMQETAQVVES